MYVRFLMYVWAPGYMCIWRSFYSLQFAALVMEYLDLRPPEATYELYPSLSLSFFLSLSLSLSYLSRNVRAILRAIRARFRCDIYIYIWFM